jgi:hypothetical protein
VTNQTRAFSLLSVAMSDAVAEERYRHRADPLEELIWHWGMAYRIWSAGGTWYARRRDRDEIMQAGDAERLSFVIRDDYFRRDRPAAPSLPPDSRAAGQ